MNRRTLLKVILIVLPIVAAIVMNLLSMSVATSGDEIVNPEIT